VRIVTIIGNRPQFVKAAAVSRLLRESHDEQIVHTGQHYDDELSKVFFDELGIPAPDRELGAGSGSNTAQTARILGALEPVLGELAPDLVLVYGDTNSTLAGALAAAQGGIRLGHVEAGMRSFDRAMPEELNRTLTDHASDLLLCSTATAMANLQRERAVGEAHLVGDVMADVSLAFRDIAADRSTILADLDLAPTRYLDFLELARNAWAILTDSGGVQKEAYLLGVPCVTLRDTTEWVETVDAGWNTLVDLDMEAALAALERTPPVERPELYGGGRAAARVRDVVAAYTARI